MVDIDALDVRLLGRLAEKPHTTTVDLARALDVSRATVQARIERLERHGAITGYGPDVDLDVLGFTISALVTLEIAQGRLVAVARALRDHPHVLEAYGTTGPGDVFCRVTARSHDELQQVLLDISEIPDVTRSVSVVALTELVPRRYLPLLRAEPHDEPARVAAQRRLRDAVER